MKEAFLLFYSSGEPAMVLWGYTQEEVKEYCIGRNQAAALTGSEEISYISVLLMKKVS